MKNKKLLVLLAFTSQGMEANQDINIDNKLQSQDINNIDSQLQKQDSRKTLYMVLGGAAAVTVAGGAIWWFTKKDKKTTEEQQGEEPIEEREFNEQDIDDMFKVNTREEWLRLYESKMKSHSETIKKVIKELEKLPDSLTPQEREQKTDEILNKNKLIGDSFLTSSFFDTEGFHMVLMKEFLNKYKKDDQIKNKPQLVEVFDQLLKLLPKQVKCNLRFNRAFQTFQSLKFYRKLEEAIQKEENQLIDERDTLQEISRKIKLVINPIDVTDVVDQEGLRYILYIMQNTDVEFLFRYIFKLPAYINNFNTLLQETVKNSSILQEVIKGQELIKQKLSER